LDYDLKGRLPTMETTPTRSRASPLVERCVAVPADASAAQQQTRAPRVDLWRAAWGTWGTQALALADQAVVSGASFLTTVVIGRWTFPSELGVYSIGISLLISSVAIQESLIAIPYTIQRRRPLGTQAEHAGSSLAQSGLLSALGIVVLAVTAVGLSVRDAEPVLVAMTWALATVLPFVLLREFGRRFAFAHLHTGQALMLDSAVAAIQLAGLWWLGSTGRLSSATACAALGAACASAAIVWLYLARGSFAMRRDLIRATMNQSWVIGKWLFAGQITVSVQERAAYWLLAVVVGTTATGVYAACMSIVLFANPLITGLGNILTPRAVLALQEGGGARLRRQVIRDSLLLGAAMALFCLVVLFAGDDVMRLLYPGEEYEGNGHTLTVLALALLGTAVGLPASNALGSIERPREVFWVGLFAAVLTAALVWWLVAGWGLLGAAYGYLAGNVAGAVGLWMTFLALVPRDGSGADLKTNPEADPITMDSDSNSASVTRKHSHRIDAMLARSRPNSSPSARPPGNGDVNDVHPRHLATRIARCLGLEHNARENLLP
jgi:O-antigen/teichoic acid export membrane protein